MTKAKRGGRDENGRFLKGSNAARDAGRKGGELSTGSFLKGEERAREAGRKGGRMGGRWVLKQGLPDELFFP